MQQPSASEKPDAAQNAPAQTRDDAPPRESSIEARRAAASPDSDEISGDTPRSQMPQL